MRGWLGYETDGQQGRNQHNQQKNNIRNTIGNHFGLLDWVNSVSQSMTTVYVSPVPSVSAAWFLVCFLNDKT